MSVNEETPACLAMWESWNWAGIQTVLKGPGAWCCQRCWETRHLDQKIAGKVVVVAVVVVAMMMGVAAVVDDDGEDVSSYIRKFDSCPVAVAAAVAVVAVVVAVAAVVAAAVVVVVAVDKEGDT